MVMGKIWLKLMATEVPQVVLVLMRPSTEALVVVLGLLSVRITFGELIALIDPP